jgi:hypothetical protein
LIAFSQQSNLRIDGPLPGVTRRSFLDRHALIGIKQSRRELCAI